MSPSLLCTALPSIHRISKKESKIIYKPQQQKEQQRTTRHHVRTCSAPLVLPSYQQKEEQDNSKLSMDILLDAIDLDQQMRQFFRSEVVKSKNRNTNVSTFHPSHMMMARRRSKSAPGAPPSYHYQRAFNTRWITPKNETVTCASQAQEVANMIVQQHIEAVKKR